MALFERTNSKMNFAKWSISRLPDTVNVLDIKYWVRMVSLKSNCCINRLLRWLSVSSAWSPHQKPEGCQRCYEKNCAVITVRGIQHRAKQVSDDWFCIDTVSIWLMLYRHIKYRMLLHTQHFYSSAAVPKSYPCQWVLYHLFDVVVLCKKKKKTCFFKVCTPSHTHKKTKNHYQQPTN